MRPSSSTLAGSLAGLALAAAVSFGLGGLAEHRRTSSAAAQMGDGPWLHGAARGAGTFGGRGAIGAGLEALERDGTAAAPASARADAGAIIAAGSAGTYIAEVLASSDSLVTRWAVRTGAPLTFWVQPGGALPGWTSAHRRMVAEAFGEWNDAGLPVRFEERADSAAADVVVLWRGQFGEPISGKTRWTHDRRGWIRNARVTIALRRYTGEPLDGDAVRAIALHEIGHALGLDHTADATNVMAAKVRVRTLSGADRATAQLLYRLPAGSLKR